MHLGTPFYKATNYIASLVGCYRTRDAKNNLLTFQHTDYIILLSRSRMRVRTCFVLFVKSPPSIQLK